MPFGFFAMGPGGDTKPEPEVKESSHSQQPVVGGILDLSKLASFSREIALVERQALGDRPVTYEEAQVRNEERKIRNSNLNAYIAEFLEQLQGVVIDTQHRLISFSSSKDPQPQEAARELLELISRRGERLQTSLLEYQETILSPSNAAELNVNYDGYESMYRLATNPAKILGEVLRGLSTVSAHLAPLVNSPRGEVRDTIEAYKEAKEVSSEIFCALGDVLAGERGISITISGLRNRVLE